MIISSWRNQGRSPEKVAFKLSFGVERAIFYFTKGILDYSGVKKKLKEFQSPTPSYIINIVNTTIIGHIYIPLGGHSTISPLALGMIHSKPHDIGLGPVPGK